MQVYNDELRHHGVLGMKWGHHKTGSKKDTTTHRTTDKKTNNELIKNGAKVTSSTLIGLGAMRLTNNYLLGSGMMNETASYVSSLIVGVMAAQNTAKLLNY